MIYFKASLVLKVRLVKLCQGSVWVTQGDLHPLLGAWAVIRRDPSLSIREDPITVFVLNQQIMKTNQALFERIHFFFPRFYHQWHEHISMSRHHQWHDTIIVLYLVLPQIYKYLINICDLSTSYTITIISKRVLNEEFLYRYQFLNLKLFQNFFTTISNFW